MAEAVHAVYLNGNVVMNPVEFETGPQGYVIFLNDQLPREGDSGKLWVREIRRGGVAVEFIDGTYVE